MAQFEWGFIGFGEVGSTFACHIGKRLRRAVFVFDPILNSNAIPTSVRKRLEETPVNIVRDIACLAGRCNAVISVVTPRVASSVARQAARKWGKGLFIDFNSVSPSEKRSLAVLFPRDTYVDGAILGSVTMDGAAVPLAIAGPRAGRAAASFRKIGLTVRVAEPRIGMASALKMCRSIFMKGLECLFVETLLAAAEFGLEKSVLKSIEQTFQSYGFQRMVQMLVTTHAIHCGRRSDEMRSAARMMRQIGVPIHMTKAARDLLCASSEAGLSKHFDGEVPDAFGPVITYLKDTYGRMQ